MEVGPDAEILMFDRDCRIRAEFVNEIGIQTVYDNALCVFESNDCYIVTNRDGEMGRHFKGNNTKVSYKIIEE